MLFFRRTDSQSVCKWKAEACHSNSAQRLITLLITRANRSISRTPVNTTEKPQKMRAWSSTFSPPPRHEMTVTQHIKALQCSNWHTILVNRACSFRFKMMLKQLCSASLFLPSSVYMKNVPKQRYLTVWSCPLFVRGVQSQWLTHSQEMKFAREIHHEICQGPLSRNYTYRMRADLWWLHSNLWKKAEMDISRRVKLLRSRKA